MKTLKRFFNSRGRYITLILGLGNGKTLGRKERKVHPAQTWTIPMIGSKSMEKEAVTY